MTKKKPNTSVTAFRQELIDSILNERRKFDMSHYTTGHRRAIYLKYDEYLAMNNKPATCGTALCMAGHIESLRQKLAKSLATQCAYSNGQVDHARLAAKIWEVETGTECRLDFICGNIPVDRGIDDMTRKDAVAHIKGRSKSWPLLLKNHDNYDH